MLRDDIVFIVVSFAKKGSGKGSLLYTFAVRKIKIYSYALCRESSTYKLLYY